MKALLSKAETDGEVTWNPKTGSLEGLVGVENLTLDNGRVKAEIERAGNIVFDGLDPDESLNPTRKPIDGQVKTLDDALLTSSHTPPTEFRIFGTLTFGKAIVPFRGRFLPTGYFRTAWESLTNPAWEGDRFF